MSSLYERSFLETSRLWLTKNDELTQYCQLFWRPSMEVSDINRSYWTILHPPLLTPLTQASQTNLAEDYGTKSLCLGKMSWLRDLRTGCNETLLIIVVLFCGREDTWAVVLGTLAVTLPTNLTYHGTCQCSHSNASERPNIFYAMHYKPVTSRAPQLFSWVPLPLS